MQSCQQSTQSDGLGGTIKQGDHREIGQASDRQKHYRPQKDSRTRQPQRDGLTNVRQNNH